MVCFRAICHPFIAAVPALVSMILIAGCGSSKTASRSDADFSFEDIGKERRIILLESRKWLGTPYRYGGDTMDGADCSGFVSRVFEKVGIALPHRASDMYLQGTGVTREVMRPGDLVFFERTAGPGITHVGIYIGREQFIHASTSKGVITSTLRDTYYERHYVGARDILKMP